jgi:DNA-binding protein HU-beta
MLIFFIVAILQHGLAAATPDDYWSGCEKRQRKRGERSMDKNELVEQVARESGLSRYSASRAVESMLSTISKALAAADKVQLEGFGSFSARQSPAQKTSHPDCGAIVPVPAKRAVRFKGESKADLVVQ